MPNHVLNVIKFKKSSYHELEGILSCISSFNSSDPLAETSNIDFNKIIPEPNTPEECPENCRILDPDILGKDCVGHTFIDIDIDDKKPWFSRHFWRLKYWGTKWNAYDSYCIFKRSSVTLIFKTAWSAPLQIYERLAKMFPETHIEIRYSEENYYDNGLLVHNPDDKDKLWSKQSCTGFPDEMSLSEQFGRRLWRKYG